jgi:hypothetical protein
MPSIAKDLFKSVWSIFSEAVFVFLLIFAFLVYYNIVNISERAMFLLATVGYGCVVAFKLQGDRKRRKEEMETERTLVLRNSQMFLVEVFAFFAAVGVMAIVYFSKRELTIVTMIQSLFIFFIVKIVNWYYLKQRI